MWRHRKTGEQSRETEDSRDTDRQRQTHKERWEDRGRQRWEIETERYKMQPETDKKDKEAQRCRDGQRGRETER